MIIRALDKVTCISSSSVVFVGQVLTLTMSVSSVPSTDLLLDLVLRKNQTGAGSTLIPLTPAEVTVPISQLNFRGLLSGVFTATALVPLTQPPLSVDVSFLISGPSAPKFQPSSQLPRFIVTFAPLREITVNVPSTMYKGLDANFTVTVDKAPETGQVLVTAIPAAILNVPSAPQFTWDQPTTPVQMLYTLTPNDIGLADIIFSVVQLGTTAYKTTAVPASQVFIDVRNPTKIGLAPFPSQVYFGAANIINVPVVITGDPLTGADDVQLLLTTNNTDVVMFPANGRLAVPSSTGVFTVYCTTTTWASFNLTFVSKLNRFVLDAPNAIDVPVQFRPLKPISVSPPGPSYIVGQEAQFTVTIAEKPSPGFTLVASLVYGGSPGNIYMPPDVGFTSATTLMYRQLKPYGTSPTAIETLSVVFSGDPQYNLTAFVHWIIFDPLLNVVASFPNSLFHNRTVPGLTITIEELSLLTVRPVTTPADAIIFDPPLLNWTASDTSTVKTLSLTAVKLVETVTISFVLGSIDASKFNIVPKQVVSVVAGDAILVIAPSTTMTVYLKPGMTVKIGVEISHPPSGTMYVTPQFGACVTTGFADFTVTPLEFTPTSPLIQYTEIYGIHAEPKCALQFPLSGVTTSFVGTSQLYSVIVRKLYTIGVDLPSKRVFLGPLNKAPLNIVVDKDLATILNPKVMVPLASQIVAEFSTSEPCIRVNPTKLIWAAGSLTEPLVKAVFVEAVCLDPRGVGTDLKININVTTANTIFNITAPAAVYVNAVPLLRAVTTGVGTTATDFYMWVGSNSLTFEVTLPELLEPTEQMEVAPIYSGVPGSISSINALWVPSPFGKKSQFLLISSVAISPRAPLAFKVTGPSRYQPYTDGGGTLEIFGPMFVIAHVPPKIYAGNNYTFRVQVQDRPYPGQTVTVTPVWSGASTALLFDPPQLKWTFGTPTLEQNMVLAALEPSSAYYLRFPVAGSSRFTDMAFDQLVPIWAPTVVTHRSLPQQLMETVPYSMTVDIGVLPPDQDVLKVTIDPELNFMLPCISVSPSTLEFSNAMPIPSIAQSVSIAVLRVCDQKLMKIRFILHGNASSSYNRTVVPRLFQTVRWSSLSVSWQSEAYIGASNAPEILLKLRTLPTGTDNATVTISQVIENGTASASVVHTTSAEWFASSPAERSITLYGVTAGNCTLRFSAASPTPGFVFATADYTIEFFPLLFISRTALISSFYQYEQNQQQLVITLSDEIKLLQNGNPVQLTITPQSANGRVDFQPSVITWAPDQRPTAILYVKGLLAGGDVVSFASSGTAAPLLLNGLPSAGVTILPLILITYSASPEVLYVGAINERVVTLTAPNVTDALEVSVTIDGERNAMSIFPAVLSWPTAASPRALQITMRGVYGSPIGCKLKYKVTVGPSFVGVQSTVGVKVTMVTDLKPLTRDPPDMVFRRPEQSQIRLSFTPKDLLVLCTFKPPHTTSMKADNVTNKTTIFLDLPSDGFNTGTPIPTMAYCQATDPIFAPLAPFQIFATPKKQFSISPALVQVFVGTTARVEFLVSESPKGGTMMINPDMSGLNRFWSLDPPVILFTSSSAQRVMVTVSGTNVTGGPRLLPMKLSGPITEYRIDKSNTEILVEVRDPLNLTVTAGRNLRLTRTDTHYVAYTGTTNGGIFIVDITGMPLTGPIRVTPGSSSADVKFSPPSVRHVSRQRRQAVRSVPGAQFGLPCSSRYLHLDYRSGGVHRPCEDFARENRVPRS